MNRYIEFCIIGLEKHSETMTEIELEKLKANADEISKRCEIIIKRRR